MSFIFSRQSPLISWIIGVLKGFSRFDIFEDLFEASFYGSGYGKERDSGEIQQFLHPPFDFMAIFLVLGSHAVLFHLELDRDEYEQVVWISLVP